MLLLSYNFFLSFSTCYTKFLYLLLLIFINIKIVINYKQYDKLSYVFQSLITVFIDNDSKMWLLSTYLR